MTGSEHLKTAAPVGCSWSVMFIIYQKWSKERTVAGEPATGLRLADARRLACAVQSNRRATYTAEKVTAIKPYDEVNINRRCIGILDVKA